MKKFLALLEVEFRSMVLVLVGIFGFLTVISGWLFYSLATELGHEIVDQLSSDFRAADFVNETGGVTLIEIMNYNWRQFHYLLFMLALLLVIVIVGFSLWYKEWVGKSKRIYFLLSLKGTRFTIFLSKLVAMMSAVWIFYGMLLVNLFIGSQIAERVLPDGVLAANLVRGVLLSGHEIIAIVIPVSFSHFILKTLLIATIFNALSCLVLMDRSKRIVGFIGGLLYCIALSGIFVYLQHLWLFHDERVLVNWGFALVANVLSLAISYFLINQKVSI